MARNLNPPPSVEREPLEAQVMDVRLDVELGEEIPLGSRCYMSNTKEIRLIPDHRADYTCRWIHFASANPSFDQFKSIVHDLMLGYGERERKAVQDGLRRFRALNEVRGSHGPTFRPEFAAFNPDAGQGNEPWCHIDSRRHYSAGIPAFYCLPTIHFETTVDTAGLSPPFALAKPHASSPSSLSTSSSSSTRSSASSSSLSPPPSHSEPAIQYSMPPSPSTSTVTSPRPPSTTYSSTPPHPPGSLPLPHAPFPAELRFSSASDASGVQEGKMETHSKKSLLHYKYRFGKEPKRRKDLLLSNHLSELSMEPTVHETWCLVVDRKNLVTVSRFTGGEIWPRGIHSSMIFLDKMPICFRMALWDYLQIQDHLGELNWWMELATLFPIFMLLLLAVCVLVVVVNDLVSLVLPIVWAPVYMLQTLLYPFAGPGVGLSILLGIMSVIFTLLRLNPRYHTWLRNRGKKVDWIVKLLTTVLGPLLYSIGTPDLELTSPELGRHMNHWIEVEEKMRSQEDPPEEVFKALRRLWIILLHFSVNFFAAPNGKIYWLDVHCVERRLIRGVWDGIKRLARKIGIGFGNDGDIQPNAIKVSKSPRKKGETLQDLETEFLAALENLELQLSVADADIGSVNRSEEREMLRSIYQSAGYPAMSCMLRMCTITTPTRFPIASRQISELYARRVSEEEFLTRDSVTQSLIYLISDTEDDLRILKGILDSQQKVIDQVARCYAEILVRGSESQLNRSTAPRNETERLPYLTPTYGYLGRNSAAIAPPSNEETFQALVDSLKRKAHHKHDIFMGEIQRYEEAIARLKAQSTLLISIKTERQEAAIFVFTLVTVIFLPLSFVTSYLGMNTVDMRDMEAGQGFFWEIAAPLTVFVLFVSWLIARPGLTWKIYRQRKRLRNVEDWKWRYRD